MATDGTLRMIPFSMPINYAKITGIADVLG
jgi:hypothetical protein